MTDPTTRYPVPDDPGSAPLATASAAPPSPPPPVDGPATGTPASSPPAAPPATGWEPARDDGTRWPAIVFGLIMIVVGLWFFAETTLGIDLPTIRWGQLWPLILIGVGILILWGTRVRRRP